MKIELTNKAVVDIIENWQKYSNHFHDMSAEKIINELIINAYYTM